MKNIIMNLQPGPLGAASIVLACLALSGCYDKFDPESYRPEFSIGGFTATDQIAPDNLVAYWSFDGGYTESVSGTDATNKQASIINGFKGQAVHFSATNPSWLTFEPGEAITGLESFTISFWLNPDFVDNDASNGVDGILGLIGLSNPSRFWGNIEWFVENNSNPDAAILKVILTHNNEVETDIVVNNYKGLFDQWTHHALTYDAGTSMLTYYINGARAASKTTPWTGPISFVNSGPMVFGTTQFQTSPSLTNHGPETWASHLTGSIDEVRIYNAALAEADVGALVVLQGKGK